MASSGKTNRKKRSNPTQIDQKNDPQAETIGKKTRFNNSIKQTQSINKYMHQNLNEIFQIVNQTSTTTTTCKGSSSTPTKNQYFYLEKMEESGLIELRLWPLFIKLAHNQHQEEHQELDIGKCAYLIALLVNQRCCLRGSNSSYIDNSDSTGTNTSAGSLSFLFHNGDVKGDVNVFQLLLENLLTYHSDKDDKVANIKEETTKVTFLITAFNTLLGGRESGMKDNEEKVSKTKSYTNLVKETLLELVSIGLWAKMPPRYLDLLLHKSNAYTRRWNLYNHQNGESLDSDTIIKLESYLPKVLGNFLSILKKYNCHDDKENGQNDKEKDSSSCETIKAYEIDFFHTTLQLILDLLSTTATRRYLRQYLLSINFSVKCTISKFYKSCIASSSSKESSSKLLFLQLITMLQDLETFGINDITAEPLSKSQIKSLYHERAHVLQKMCHRYYPNELSEILYAGVGMVSNYAFLRRNLDRIVNMDVLVDIACRLRLLSKNDNDDDNDDDGILDDLVDSLEDHDDEKLMKMKREFVTQILLYHHTLRLSEEQSLSQLPLYPDEKLLWNPHLVPPGHLFLDSSSGPTTTLALPKMNMQFLSFADYLLRSFKLLRLESAYEIRSDLVDAIKRMRPVRRHNYDNDDNDDHLDDQELWSKKRTNTEFHGWSRMALELTDNISSPVKLLKVSPPKLGESIPSQVIAEITLDLKRCGDNIRKEWDEIGEFDNLFLLAVDATKIEGGPAPLLQEGNERDKERRLPDEEDVSFPHRFGIVAVRGCMVLEVRDAEGTVLSDPSRFYEENQAHDDDHAKKNKKKNSFKRFLKVALDPAQYAADVTGNGSSLGIQVYQMLNVVVRRKGKENNFKAVLETVRGLMQGSASVNRSIPSWLQPVFLGFGDPSSASFSSRNMISFARNTIGVTSPDAALDYGDTFLDENHLRESFLSSNILVDGQIESTSSINNRQKYRIKVTKDDSKSIVAAESYSFPAGVNGNPVRFTPVQVKAIRSGLSPGLTLIVGPPGTGKTDVAVQIIANLYHSFPSQRTVLVTHSNAALNDLFAKVMARGDVDERYMLRLGSGERDLQTESEFDFTKIGRVNYILSRRAKLLEEVQLISESLGISGAAERGLDGSPSYTCETAEYFYLHHVQKRIQIFHSSVKEKTDDSTISTLFPFKKYFGLTGSQVQSMTLADAKEKFVLIRQHFNELAEYRPFELLRSQRQRTDYLLTKQARIVAMTCTHAAIARSQLVELGFQYDNILMEEAGQMLDIETFVPLLLQRGEAGANSSASRLKRICLIGDHNQLPPVVKNITFSKYSNLDQSLFTRLIRLGVPSIELNKQGRARAEIANLYNWRYKNLGNLDFIGSKPEFLKANAGFLHNYQVINVEDYEGRGESTPTAYFYQNVGEAEYAVALFQYMVLIGYPPENISILTTYNGQKELLNDIITQRCGANTPMGGVRPGAISTVDHYQGQQNDFIILSLVRTNHIGHIRDIRRLVVAVSRARLGLYVLCRQQVFNGCHTLRKVMDQFAKRPNKLELLIGEQYPTDRALDADTSEKKTYVVNEVSELGSIVHSMQQQMC